jgi:raffinose/stachyose/melibiose transport system permease protein
MRTPMTPAHDPQAPQARSYPAWFFVPAAVVFGVLFLAPMLAAFYFSLTRWTLFESTFIGFDNFAQFLREPFLVRGCSTRWSTRWSRSG